MLRTHFHQKIQILDQNSKSSKSKLRFSWQAIMKMCYWNGKFNNYKNWIIGAESNSYLTLISPHSENYKNIHLWSGQSWVKVDGLLGGNWTVKTAETARSKRPKVDGLGKWTVLKLKSRRSISSRFQGIKTGRKLWNLWTVLFYPLIHSDRPLRTVTVHFGSKDHPLSFWNVHYGFNDCPVRLKTVDFWIIRPLLGSFTFTLLDRPL